LLLATSPVCTVTVTPALFMCSRAAVGYEAARDVKQHGLA